MVFHIFAYVSIAIVVFLLFLILFEPSLPYSASPIDCELSSNHFICLLSAVSDAQLHERSSVEPFVGGEAFYEAELEAIRSAQQSIHLEAFIFHPSPIGDRFLDALSERARAGVDVRLVIDWVGSLPTPNRYFDGLRKAGGKVSWYQPLRWYTFKRFNNRTHRELLVVDGKIGFIGGAGIASHWLGGDKGKPPCRDMMCRVRGELVIGLQSCFAENWLETTGQILDVSREFPGCGCEEPDSAQKVQSDDSQPARGMVVISTPSAARSSRARVLFQVLMASARKTVYINSPYFLPDRAARRQMIKSVREGGVRVVVVAPNNYNNHYIARTASRRVYGQLIRAGVEIHEYQPSMIHKKAMVVDGEWSVIGSTNFDHRSFGLNDEVNLAAYDPTLAQSLERDFQYELSQSQRITYEAWKHRPLHEKLFSFVGLLLQRQS